MDADRVKHDITSLESYFKSSLAKEESITLCNAFRIGTLDLNTTDMSHLVKIVLGSVEEKQLGPKGRKKLDTIMLNFFHESYRRAEPLKYRALKEELQFRKDKREKTEAKQ